MADLGTSGAEVRLRPAAGGDLPDILGLLHGAELPREGVEEALAGFVVAEAGGRVVAAGAVETHGTDGLLRSVAVDPARRGEGVGAAVVRRLLADARGQGLGRLYLLTTTADRWFPRLGFRVVPREEVPEAVRGSAEFRDVCPASATVMMLALDGPDPEA